MTEQQGALTPGTTAGSLTSGGGRSNANRPAALTLWLMLEYCDLGTLSVSHTPSTENYFIRKINANKSTNSKLATEYNPCVKT